jgi:hypothetical protein
VARDEPHVSVGGLLEAGRIRKERLFWEERHEERDNWKEEQHTHMHGRPNEVRVGDFVIHCNS